MHTPSIAALRQQQDTGRAHSQGEPEDPLRQAEPLGVKHHLTGGNSNGKATGANSASTPACIHG